eukprot:tig00020934_g16098.t1
MRWEEYRAKAFVVPGLADEAPGLWRPQRRISSTLTCIDDVLYLFGGADDKRALNDCWMFSKAIRAWCPLFRPSVMEESGRKKAPGARGGRKTTGMDPVFAEWEDEDDANPAEADPTLYSARSAPRMTAGWNRVGLCPPPRSGHTASVFDADPTRVYVFGGNHLAEGRLHADLWSLDTAEDLPSWTEVVAEGTRPAPRWHHTANTFRDRLFVFGGEGRDTMPLGDVAVYSLERRRWMEVRKAVFASPEPRHLHATVRYGEKLVVIGGMGADVMTPVEPCWVFDAELMTWNPLKTTGSSPFCSTPGGPVDTTLIGHTAVIHGSTVVVFGGSRGGTPLNNTYLLDLVTNEWHEYSVRQQWETDAGPPAARWKHASAVNSSTGEVYIFGGMHLRSRLNDLWQMSGVPRMLATAPAG